MMRMTVIAYIILFAGTAGIVHAAGDASAGKAKATACALCHGADGKGTQVGPKLAGLDPAHFVQALNDYRSGKKDNAIMKAQSAPLSADDMANLAAYYASLR
jgi:cytochrome c553